VPVGVLGDVGGPKPVRGIVDEAAPDQVLVRGWERALPTAFAVVADPGEPGAPHQPGGNQGETHEMLIFGQALVASLRPTVGQLPVLGRVGRDTAEPGQSPPWILQSYTDADAELATGWISNCTTLFY